VAEKIDILGVKVDSVTMAQAVAQVEGYMDVIALHSAGFTGAVAPLGTALTENQIKILWQSCDEPLICFDGDGAGRKASLRALYRALPILTAGKSLRFVSLPDPYDPDDMIRKKSPEAFRQVLNESQSLADLLWQDLRNTYPTDTPERQALFEKKVKETLAKIQDAGVRSYYQNDFKDRIWRLFHTKHTAKKAAKIQQIHTPVAGTQDIKMMLSYVISYPVVGEAYLDDLMTIPIADKHLKNLLGDIAALMMEEAGIQPETLKERLGNNSFSDLKSELEMVQKSAKTDDEVRHILSAMIRESKRKILESEIKEKTEIYFQNPSEEVWESIKVLKKEIEKLCESE